MTLVDTLRTLEYERREQIYKVQMQDALKKTLEQLAHHSKTIEPKELEGLLTYDREFFAPMYEEFKDTCAFITETLDFFSKEHKAITPWTLGTGGLVGAGVFTGLFIGTGVLFPVVVAAGMVYGPCVKQIYTYYKGKKEYQRFKLLPKKIDYLQTLSAKIEQTFGRISDASLKHKVKNTLQKTDSVHVLYQQLASYSAELFSPDSQKVWKVSLS